MEVKKVEKKARQQMKAKIKMNKIKIITTILIIIILIIITKYQTKTTPKTHLSTCHYSLNKIHNNNKN